MTCIVGYVDGDIVYIGGDSIGSNSHNQEVYKCSKVVRLPKSEIIIGYTSSFRMGQILECHFKPPEQKNRDTYKYMVKKFIPALKTCCTKHGFIKDKDTKPEIGTFLVGIKDRLFIVQDDLAVLEANSNYNACGSGAETALGAMYALERIEEISPDLKVYVAIEAACNHISTVGGPIKVLSTDSSDRMGTEYKAVEW